MVLAFNSGGDYARTVYGDSNSQHAGANGAIATNPPVAPMAMKGGKRNKSQRNNKKRVGKSQRNRSQRNNKSRRNRRNQRGGK